jgi:hypothetical protein
MKSIKTWMTWITTTWSNMTIRREGAYEQCQRKLNEANELAYKPIAKPIGNRTGA